MTADGWRGWPDQIAARRWIGLFAAMLAGVVAALGQAPVQLMPATLVGLAAGFALIETARAPRRAAALGWAFGLGYFALTMVWIVQPFLVEADVFGWMAPFALFFMAGGMALFWGGGTALATWLAPGRLSWLALAASLGLMEWLRGWIFTGLPWGGPGLAWIDHPPAQIAALVGVYGLNAVSFALAAALWPALGDRRATMGWVIALFAVWGVGAGLEARVLPRPEAPKTVRLIQPNADQKRKWDPDWVLVFFDRALALSAAAPEGPEPDLVIWPETSIPSLLGQVDWIERDVRLATSPAPVVAGIQRRNGAGNSNSLVLFDGGPDPVWVYDKHHLVPFGEYMPMAGLMERFGLYGLAQINGVGFVPGVGPEVQSLPDGLGRVLPLICYEAIFPRDIRRADERPDWLLQATNDAWFGTFSGPQQHLVQARFRAIEFGLPFARAANTGISAMIGPKGEIIGALGLNEAGFLDVPLPAALPPTLYAKIGNAPLVILLLGVLLGVAAQGRRKAVDRAGPDL